MRALMIFDGDCAFCTTSANFMRRRIRPRCDIKPWQRTDIAAFEDLQDREELRS